MLHTEWFVIRPEKSVPGPKRTKTMWTSYLHVRTRRRAGGDEVFRNGFRLLIVKFFTLGVAFFLARGQ